MINKSLKHNSIVRSISIPFRNVFKFFSPIKYVKQEYKYITGHKLNLNSPTRYTEKLQYLRLFVYPNNKQVIKCASKVSLKEYLKDKKYDDFIVPTLGIYDNFEDINFHTLPQQFVMKCSHASGFNYICYDKSKINMHTIRKKFKKWLSTDYGKLTVEEHYSKIKPQIIIEPLLLENGKLPFEYKIHVFNGKAKYLYVVSDRNNGIHYNNYYIDWTEFDGAQFNNWTKSQNPISKPLNLDTMIKISEDLASFCPFCRVDFYLVNNKIYISEMTFTPAKGTLKFDDDSADFIIGNWLSISK